MCGIAAIFSYNNRVKNADIVKWLRDANRVQQARGPDGAGIWFSKDKTVGLAHRRLAIIDLSHAGNQPMSSEDGQLCITYNGEIYNYKSLRYKLGLRGYKLRTNSDTEILLHLYSEYGEAMVEHLRGMYAFALWDENRSGLFLARDPFGIKPLYYSDDGHAIRVASQVKTLLTGCGIDTSPEAAGHVGFFLWGYVPEPFTLYRGIRSLPSGTTLWLSKHRTVKEIKAFYNLAEKFRRVESRRKLYVESYVKDRLKIALDDSVKHHMISDVPVGLFLSAGLDSTSIAALASRLSSEPLKTITLGFYNYRGTKNDETCVAKSIAKKINYDHRISWISLEDLSPELPNIFRSMDQPSIDGVNTYFICKAAREIGLKVALSGLGGDELFGGYPSFRDVPRIVCFARHLSLFGKKFRVLTEPILRQFTSPKFAGLLEYGGSVGGAYLLRRGLFMPWELPEILDPEMVREGWRKLDPIVSLNQAVDKINSRYHSISALEIMFYMRNMLLRDADWAGMANSLEVRFPFLDLELINAIVPLMWGSEKPQKKTIAKAAWGKIPVELLNRPKSGFSFPIAESILRQNRKKENGLRSWARLVYSESQKKLPEF